MKFADFNRMINPSELACYTIKTPKEEIKDTTYAESVNILKSDKDATISVNIPKGIIVICIESQPVIDTIIKRNEKVFIYKIKNKYYIIGKDSFSKNTTNNVLACGCNADTIVNTKAGKRILLPFHSPSNTLEIFKDISIVYENTIDKIPVWLKPIKTGSSNTKNGLDLPIVSNVKTILANHVLSLTGYTKAEQKQVLEFMNDNLVSVPLSKDDADALLESITDNFMDQFMNKSEFLHDKLGDYVIQACNIKKDKKSNKLYFYDTKKNIYVSDQRFLTGYITRLIPRLKKYQKEEVINYITDYLEYDAVQFNKEEFNIVFKNGILHLIDMTFEPMSPDELESIQINVNYDPNAYSDTAVEFFNNVTCGDKDAQTLLYEAIGYAMLKTVELAKLFMMTGTGRNGKSTFIELVTNILGEENCASVSLKDMSNNFRVGNLEGKLASLAADISSQPISDSDLLKSITSGDRIMIERKYEQPYESRIYATQFYGCNKLPKTPDTSDGFYRRWVIIPFDADLSKVRNAEGFEFKKKLFAQESLDYVAYKAVQAIYKVFNTTKDFTEPSSVSKMLAEYKVLNSSILSWVKEAIENDVGRLKNLVNSDRAYGNYCDWCKTVNRTAFSKQSFNQEIKAHFNLSGDPIPAK